MIPSQAVILAAMGHIVTDNLVEYRYGFEKLFVSNALVQVWKLFIYHFLCRSWDSISMVSFLVTSLSPSVSKAYGIDVLLV